MPLGSPGHAARAIAVGLFGMLALAPATSPRIDWRALGDAYDQILDARFEQSEATLRQSSGVPREAAHVLKAVAIWWQIQIDPESRALDGAFESTVNEAIRAADAWAVREPESAEAWFFLGGAYGARVPWRVQRGQRLAAARDGKRIKDALERAIALDKTLSDAYFGIGLYHYYADVAPTVAKMLRWLLLLPGGDRQMGLREMTDAMDRGRIVRNEAEYQLHLVYLWYEQNPEKGLELLTDLEQRFPHNPHFLERIASVEDVYFHNAARSREAYQALLDSARARSVAFPTVAASMARLGLGVQLDALCETDRAIDELNALIASRPDAPYDAMARAQLQLGVAFDRMGRPEAALDAYRASLGAVSRDDPFEIKERVRVALGRRPDPKAGEAFRLSIEGWRRLERHDLEDADRAFRRSLQIAPDDPVTLYRQARLFAARGQNDRARAGFEHVISKRADLPSAFHAAACLELAKLSESVDRVRAIELYRTASRIRGADRATRAASQAALARLGPP